MNFKNFLGFVAIAIVAGKGMYRFYQYYNDERSFDQTLADVAKDGLDGVTDVVGIFSNNQEEVDLCEDISEMGKGVIGSITEKEEW